ncbi:class I SAM-dependent methyltransferase [Pseudonocardia sp. RS11V-5]|uniref:class I SAM-dependent methyltransferase n=1 Tax=Pseudonocardia terrae TaxID=2905831 RepID=UPI001E480FEC|nr:class I SAM-dependent methyltransferase [Pseudonocardia terrae]MCE3552269.1 class I SAM-dependent methyltransferase [Pseudonocardia terrae]
MSTPTTDPIRTIGPRHRALWAAGDYGTVAADLIPGLGAVLVEAVDVRSGQRVLDVGAGTGNASIPAAAAGAEVVASDLTPELLEQGRRIARARGLYLEWVEADAQSLPFETGEFDVVISCVGSMFAPFHERTAAETLRVCRPGGTIGLINWTPEGFVGQLFATMKPFAPPPPPGARPAPLWGSEEHVRELFGTGVRALRAEKRTCTLDVSDSPQDFREWWKRHYGPTIAVYRNVAGDPARTAELDAAFLDLLTRTRTGGVWESEYLLVTAERA